MKGRLGIFILALTSVLFLTSGIATAVDGVVLIDQARALAGSVTPGDTPGFPVTISVAGSYRLSGNLTVPDADTTAISVTSDNVSIDLNGFAILGPVTCTGNPISCTPTGTGNGINVEGLPRTIGIRNGEIRGMGSAGISCGSSGAVVNVSDMRVLQNGWVGIIVANGMVTGSSVTTNGTTGIAVSGTGTVIGNHVSHNGTNGIQVNNGLVSQNTSSANGSVGLRLTLTVGYWGNALTANNAGGAQVHLGVDLGNNLVLP
jgi:hypothetical protein